MPFFFNPPPKQAQKRDNWEFGKKTGKTVGNQKICNKIHILFSLFVNQSYQISISIYEISRLRSKVRSKKGPKEGSKEGAKEGPRVDPKEGLKESLKEAPRHGPKLDSK